MDTRFELYKKCIRGECTPEEASLVEGWLKEDPKIFETEMLAEIVQMEKDKEIPLALKQEMLDYFRQKGLPVPARRKIRWIGWTAAAAAVIAVVVAIWMLRGNGPVPHSTDWITVSNNSNKVKQVVLPDSSRVWLNAFGEIRYPRDFDKQAWRQVRLEGEAFFKIKDLAGHAFLVEAGNVQTWVLGTEFNIEAYADEDMIKVSLQTGKVRVNYLQGDSGLSEGKILLPGQMAVYEKGGTQLSVGRSTVVEPSAWINEEIVLNDVPLRDALQRIGRKYKERILFDTVLANNYRHITAHYRAETLDQVLAQLGFTCDFTAKKYNKSYQVAFKKVK